MPFLGLLKGLLPYFAVYSSFATSSPTSVKFVRLNQYTVYPYAFHLIDLYVENVLRFL